MSTIAKSRDGYHWTANDGLQSGIPSIGVIQPASNLRTTEEIFDVLVIGAGYSGLTATRDMTTSGLVHSSSPLSDAGRY
jgi:heterodisulfide reductase subunit A-like polyferredoxin